MCMYVMGVQVHVWVCSCGRGIISVSFHQWLVPSTFSSSTVSLPGLEFTEQDQLVAWLTSSRDSLISASSALNLQTQVTLSGFLYASSRNHTPDVCVLGITHKHTSLQLSELSFYHANSGKGSWSLSEQFCVLTLLDPHWLARTYLTEASLIASIGEYPESKDTRAVGIRSLKLTNSKEILVFIISQLQAENLLGANYWVKYFYRLHLSDEEILSLFITSEETEAHKPLMNQVYIQVPVQTLGHQSLTRIPH